MRNHNSYRPPRPLELKANNVCLTAHYHHFLVQRSEMVMISRCIFLFVVSAHKYAKGNNELFGLKFFFTKYLPGE